MSSFHTSFSAFHSTRTFSRTMSDRWSQSSHSAEPLWIDPGIKSGIRVRELISTLTKRKKKKSADREWMVEHSPETLASEEEKPPLLHVWSLLMFCLRLIQVSVVFFDVNRTFDERYLVIPVVCRSYTTALGRILFQITSIHSEVKMCV